MRKVFLLSFALILCMLLAFNSVQAQIPKTLNFQAMYLDATNQPLNKVVPIEFKIYKNEYGGQPLWVEIQDVNAQNGYVNVYLGTINPLNLRFDDQLWLEVKVGNGTPYPRTRLSSVPTAFNAFIADTAEWAQGVLANGVKTYSIENGAVTQEKLAPGVQAIPWGVAGGDLAGNYPNPTLRPGAVLANIEDGSITQDKLAPNVTTPPSGPAGGDLTGTYPDPLIAVGAVKTDRIANGAVTGVKIAQDAVGPFQIAPSGVYAGTYGDMYNVGQFVVDEDGRITWAGNVLIHAADDATVSDIDITGNGPINMLDMQVRPNTIGEPELISSGVTAGTYGNRYNVGTFTVDRDGRLTAASNTLIQANTGAGSDISLTVFDIDKLNMQLNQNVVTIQELNALNKSNGLKPQAAADNGRFLFYSYNATDINRMSWSEPGTDGYSPVWDAATGTFKWGVPNVATLRPIMGNGSTTNPIRIDTSAAFVNNNWLLMFDGTSKAWKAGLINPPNLNTSNTADVTTDKYVLTWDNSIQRMKWGIPAATVVTANPVVGNGLPATPVTLNTSASFVNTNQVLYFNGTNWAASFVNSPMIQDGSVQLRDWYPATTFGQVPYWDGTSSTWQLSGGTSPAAPVFNDVMMWKDDETDGFPGWGHVAEINSTAMNEDLNAVMFYNGSDWEWTVAPTIDRTALVYENGSLTWSTIDISFADITSGVNEGQLLQVGDGSVLEPIGTGIVRANDWVFDAPFLANSGTFNNLQVNYGLTVGDGNGNGQTTTDYLTVLFDGYVGNNFGVANYLEVGGDTKIYGELDVDGPTTLNNTLDVDGATTINNTLVTSASATFENDVDVNGDVDIDGNTNFNGMVGVDNDYGTYNDVFVVGIDGEPEWTKTLDDLELVNTDDLVVDNSATITNNVWIGGTLDVDGATTLNNTLDVDGATTLNNTLVTAGSATFESNVDVYGYLNVDGPTTLNNTLDVDGATTLNNTLVTAGSATFESDVDIYGYLNVDGPTTLNNTLDVDGATTLNSSLDVDGPTTLNNTLVTQGSSTFRNNVFVDGALDVDGPTTLNNTLDVDGATTLNSSLDVDGPTTLNNTLVTQGSSTFRNNVFVDGALDVDGPATLNNTLDVDGATTLNSSLDVDGPTTLNNTLVTQGSSTFRNNVFVDGAFDVDGATTLNSTLDVDGATTLNSSLDVDLDANFSGRVGVDNNYGTLNDVFVVGTDGEPEWTKVLDGLTLVQTTNLVASSGTITTLLGNTATFTSNVNVGGALDVTGATTLRSTLNVSNNANFDGMVGVDGNYGTLNDVFVVSTDGEPVWTKNLNINTLVANSATITTINNSTFNGRDANFVAGGTADFNGNVNLDGATDITGTLELDGSQGNLNDVMVSQGPGTDTPIWTNNLTLNNLTVNGDLIGNGSSTFHDTFFEGNVAIGEMGDTYTFTINGYGVPTLGSNTFTSLNVFGTYNFSNPIGPGTILAAVSNDPTDPTVVFENIGGGPVLELRGTEGNLTLTVNRGTSQFEGPVQISHNSSTFSPSAALLVSSTGPVYDAGFYMIKSNGIEPAILADNTTTDGAGISINQGSLQLSSTYYSVPNSANNLLNSQFSVWALNPSGANSGVTLPTAGLKKGQIIYLVNLSGVLDLDVTTFTPIAPSGRATFIWVDTDGNGLGDAWVKL